MGTGDDINILEESSEEKDLGVIVDNKVNFRNHCDMIVGNANKLYGHQKKLHKYKLHTF